MCTTGPGGKIRPEKDGHYDVCHVSFQLEQDLRDGGGAELFHVSIQKEGRLRRKIFLVTSKTYFSSPHRQLMKNVLQALLRQTSKLEELANHIQMSFIESMRGRGRKTRTISLTVHQGDDDLIMLKSLEEKKKRKLPKSPSLHLKPLVAFFFFFLDRVSL